MARENGMTGHRDTRLLIVQRRLTHYRVPFFESLRSRLADLGVELTLAVGTPTADEETKRDEGHLKWSTKVPCRYGFGGRVCWQDIGKLAESNEFVVLTQENGLLANYGLLLHPAQSRIGLWGHGRNFQSGDGAGATLAQRWKSAWSRKADWWFAYTSVSAEVVRGIGYPEERICVLNNSIDTDTLISALQEARRNSRAALREMFGLRTQGPLGLYVGSLYGDKLLDMLIDSAEIIQRTQRDFQLAVVGDGPARPWLERRCADLPWVRLLGARGVADKAKLLAGADLMLNPGLTGLGILDAFSAGLPYLTTDCGLHSPEVAYLESMSNGLMTAPDARTFADAALRVMTDAALAARLAEGSRQSAREYGLDAMVERFCQGLLAWQSAPPLRVGGA